jgi:DNA polymerase-3 subunit delta
MRPALGFAQFEQSLERCAPEPVYLLEGEEPYFHDRAIQRLSTAALGGGAGESLDQASLDGDAATIDAILDLASTYPMGGGRRLVVVRRADALRPDAAPLAAYLARPNPRTCLVFSDTGFDRRRALYRSLAEAACRVDCRPLDEAQTGAWVRERLRARGFGLDKELAEAIVAGLSGGGLGPLDAELEKLMMAIGAPRPVGPADLEILTGVPRLERSFEIAARALRGERGQALGALRALLRAGEEPVYLLGGLAAHVRASLKAAVAAGRRLPAREVKAIYDLDPWRFERLRRDAAGAGAARLEDALGGCLRADRELKGMGPKHPAHALEILVHRLGGARPPKTA